MRTYLEHRPTTVYIKRTRIPHAKGRYQLGFHIKYRTLNRYLLTYADNLSPVNRRRNITAGISLGRGQAGESEGSSPTWSLRESGNRGRGT